jgi:hypothetical protein
LDPIQRQDLHRFQRYHPPHPERSLDVTDYYRLAHSVANDETVNNAKNTNEDEAGRWSAQRTLRSGRDL